MGSQPTTEQKKTEPEPLTKSENEQETKPSNNLETQKKSNDAQNLSNSLETEAQAIDLLIAARINAFQSKGRILKRLNLKDTTSSISAEGLFQCRGSSVGQSPSYAEILRIYVRYNLTPEQRSGDTKQPSNNELLTEEKFYDPEDTTLDFVDGEDDMDFDCNDFKSLRAKMSCGHTVTPTSLTILCKKTLDKGDCKFVCGQRDCNVEWPYEEVCKMALLTPEEMQYFEKKMFTYAAKNYLDVKSCPGCKSAVMRSDLNNLQAYCISCTAKKKRVYKFCWQCLKKWKGPAPRSDHCENDGCQSPLEILRTCPEITFKNVKGVSGCPTTRACPTCGLLAGHDTNMCKNITCPRCKVEFCFVCLKRTQECQMLKSLSYFEACSTGVAPRQTSIPVWCRK